MAQKMDENQVFFYIAGVMDSGCRIAIDKAKNGGGKAPTYRPVIEITRQRREVLDIVHNTFGGYMRNFKSRSYVLRVKGWRAYVMARAMYQYVHPDLQTDLQRLLDLATVSCQRRRTGFRESLYKPGDRIVVDGEVREAVGPIVTGSLMDGHPVITSSIIERRIIRKSVPYHEQNATVRSEPSTFDITLAAVNEMPAKTPDLEF